MPPYIRRGTDDPTRMDYFYGNSTTDSRTYFDFIDSSWRAGFEFSNYRVMYVACVLLDIAPEITLTRR